MCTVSRDTVQHGGPGWEGKRFMTFLSHKALSISFPWIKSFYRSFLYVTHAVPLSSNVTLNMVCHSFSHPFARDRNKTFIVLLSAPWFINRKSMAPRKWDKNKNVIFFIKPFLFSLVLEVSSLCSLLPRNYFCTSTILLFRLIFLYLSCPSSYSWKLLVSETIPNSSS